MKTPQRTATERLLGLRALLIETLAAEETASGKKKKQYALSTRLRLIIGIHKKLDVFNYLNTLSPLYSLVSPRLKKQHHSRSLRLTKPFIESPSAGGSV